MAGEKKDEHAQKLAETTPSPLTSTTAAALPVQAPQSTTATAATSNNNKPLPQAGDSKQAPPPTAAAKEADSGVSTAPAKVQDSVPIPAPKVEADVGSNLAGDEGIKEKQQPVVEEKPAETPSIIGGITRHVSFGGVEQLGGQQQLQLGQQQQQTQPQQTQPQPASQGGLSLTASDLDIEGEMEGDGDMEGRLMLGRGSCGVWCCMRGDLIVRS